jgi:hypothetical protein
MLDWAGAAARGGSSAAGRLTVELSVFAEAAATVYPLSVRLSTWFGFRLPI